jgi:hypothetical protein
LEIDSRKFKKMVEKKSKKFYFAPMGTVKNYLGFGEQKLDFFLGGTDSCQGEFFYGKCCIFGTDVMITIFCDL